jgi:septum formation protein
VTGLILASGSKARAAILEAAGISFEVHPARVDEDAVKDSLLAEGADGRAVADALAELKAIRVSSSYPEYLTLGADQVLILDGTLVSKSADLAAARALLRQMRGKRHELVTAMVLAKGGAPVWRHVSSASLWMRAFGDAFLDDYLAASGDGILGSVGCYHLEGLGAQLFERVEGDYFSILGIALLPLLAALREQGILQR